jgi:hypothetical protein
VIDFRKHDRVVIIGDSITLGDPGACWFTPMALAVRAAFTVDVAEARLPKGVAVPVSSVDTGCPIFTNLGIAGQTTNDLVSRLPEIYALNPTGVIVAYETNCVDGNQVSNAQFTSNVDTSILELQTSVNYPLGVAPRWIAWMQCACFNESFWGSNPYDTTPGGLADKDAILRAKALALGFTLIETRTDASGNGPWKDYELANNPGGANYGYLTVDGRHLLPAGATWQSALFMESVTLVTS